MSWQNQNINKKVYTIAKPLAEEDSLMNSIPETATITAIERTTKTIRVTYVEDKTFTIDDIIKANIMTVKPIKLDRIGTIKDNSSRKEKRIICTEKVLAVLNIADFHLNRRIFANEVKYNYDINIASEVFMRIIDKAVERLKQNAFNIEKIVLNTAGDFINSDTITGTTTAGTQQINDVTWKQVFQKATALLEYALIKLSNVAPVEYFYVAGNHDEQVGFYLTSWLAARFKDTPNVEINDSPRTRKVISHKKNLLIFTHGSNEGSRAIDLPFVDPEAYSRISDATNIEVLSGHLHANTVKSERGVRWEILNSACPALDEWTFGKAYGGNILESTIMYYNDRNRVQCDSINSIEILENII
jgi:hypothetical protein